MTDLQALLDQIDRLDQQATKGPWEIVVDEYDDNIIANVTRTARVETVERIVHADDATPADREFIASARTALPQLAAAVKGVLDVLDTYPAPGKGADPTGYTTARLDLLEHSIRAAIRDAIGPRNTDLLE